MFLNGMISLNPIFIVGYKDQHGENGVGYKDQHGENGPTNPSDIAGAAYTRRRVD